MSDSELRQYYAERAAEYERVYDKPERRDDLASLRTKLCHALRDRHVLEIACGTGYWSQDVAQVAASLLSVDVNEEVLAIARQKTYPAGRVRFQIADAFDLSNVCENFDAGFSLFWWSHISIPMIRPFLLEFHSRLKPGATVVFADNIYVEGSNNPMSEKIDADGNTYSRRRLENGKTFDILKNFPTDTQLRTCVEGLADRIEIQRWKYYWLMSYRVRMQ